MTCWVGGVADWYRVSSVAGERWDDLPNSKSGNIRSNNFDVGIEDGGKKRYKLEGGRVIIVLAMAAN